ncbi:MAG: adenylyl-sulfate kinase [Candidatus Thiodiazotropha lotti]|uniref:Adenylyl-sulfate kinase n=1 Tax=Candidatus Thiodiazotropha endoloripes TaxID=1818881 RepID=A0A1E2USM3_9GAMM|nr:adenylyl-sulfate kinase [Candidatus Thiodiazotropha endoloripes]MCG7898499.1 adenylyl-sulfate kinase [Candidatus Thiodiazotropha weberae]MCG7990627.1 adenylyl-sulfate kinase [Candidatus Thiodiazotropha lotti]MCG7904367.1 adenylyl-sulfate kinase [Candidatus Thiodiazotropha weberae]MCG7915689.1 adenylyl-sulfate kinase [Candidatus Thiodiazotropha weberae]MCG7999509.1 adenylyl-sulfate kinase [Candidatus Thiodiazotropha lotti]
MSNSNIVWHSHPVDQQTRSDQKTQRPLVIWFTGLSASGKSTIAGALEQILTGQGYHTYLLDGDNVRHGLCNDLGFSDQDRQENIRRVGEVAKLMADAGLITLAAFISPFRDDRRLVRKILPEGQFIEVYVDANLEVCQTRDPKGLYAKAQRGEIKQFTGIDSPYEAPEKPEVHIQADQISVAEAVNQLLSYLHEIGALQAGYEPVALGA